MSKSPSGHFSGTKGNKNYSATSVNQKKKISPLFRNGHITYSGISAHREKFMTKSIRKVVKLLQKNGYRVEITKSKRAKLGSKAKIIKILNPSKRRNIIQVQVSPGSKRHGGVPYIKISTSDKGIIKIINGNRKDYKTDGNEKARIYFKRKRRKNKK